MKKESDKPQELTPEEKTAAILQFKNSRNSDLRDHRDKAAMGVPEPLKDIYIEFEEALRLLIENLNLKLPALGECLQSVINKPAETSYQNFVEIQILHIGVIMSDVKNYRNIRENTTDGQSFLDDLDSIQNLIKQKKDGRTSYFNENALKEFEEKSKSLSEMAARILEELQQQPKF